MQRFASYLALRRLLIYEVKFYLAEHKTLLTCMMLEQERKHCSRVRHFYWFAQSRFDFYFSQKMIITEGDIAGDTVDNIFTWL